MVYRFGDYELNQDTFELFKNGIPIHVEPQVFEVLAFLLKSDGRIVTKDELLEAVWGDVFVSEATLSSRIMAVRKALSDSAKEQLWLKTVHGRGFRFVGDVAIASRETTGPLGSVQQFLEDALRAIETADLNGADRHLESASHTLYTLEKGTADREWARWHTLRAQTILLRDGWDSEQAKEHYEESIRLAEGIGAVDVFRPARYHLATMFELRGDYEQSETMMKAAIFDASVGNGDAEAHELLACSLFHQGRFEESLVQAKRGLEVHSEGRDWRLSSFYGEDPSVSCNHWLALSLWFTGHEEEALRYASKALRLSEQPGRIFCLAHSRQQMAMLHQVRRDMSLCEHWAKATVAIGARQGLIYRESAGNILWHWARFMSGDVSVSLGSMKGSLRCIVEAGAHMETPYFQALVAECELKAGELQNAVERLDATLESLPVQRGFFFTAEILRLRAQAESLRKNGRDKAVIFLNRAMEIAEAQRAIAFKDRCRSDLQNLAP